MTKMMTENGLFVLGGPETQLHDILWAVHEGKHHGRSEGEGISGSSRLWWEDRDREADPSTSNCRLPLPHHTPLLPTPLALQKNTSVTFWAERIFFCHAYDTSMTIIVTKPGIIIDVVGSYFYEKKNHDIKCAFCPGRAGDAAA